MICRQLPDLVQVQEERKGHRDYQVALHLRQMRQSYENGRNGTCIAVCPLLIGDHMYPHSVDTHYETQLCTCTVNPRCDRSNSNIYAGFQATYPVRVDRTPQRTCKCIGTA